MPVQLLARLLIHGQVGVEIGVHENVRVGFVPVVASLLDEMPVRVRHIFQRCPQAVRLKCLYSPECQPETDVVPAPLFGAEHHDLMIAAQRDQSAGHVKFKQAIKDVFAVRPAIDVIAERDDGIIGRGRNEREQRFERRETAVNIANGERAHEGFDLGTVVSGSEKTTLQIVDGIRRIRDGESQLMGLAERFMGQPDPDRTAGDLVPNPAIERGPAYQLLFNAKLELDADALTQAIRSYHPTLAQARFELLDVELENAPPEESTSVLGLAGWANHVVKLVGFNTPIPQNVFDACVRPAHFAEQLKDDAQKHQSHLILYYAGYESDPLEQYVAMTIVAAALARFDGILLLNEAARSAFPAAALLVEEPENDAIEVLRSMPIPLLYGGFVKIEIEDQPGVWMRTFGNRLLNLPDLSYKAEGHHEGSETFDLFANMLAYVRESGSKFGAGHTMQVGEDLYLRLRSPNLPDEWYLESDGQMLVTEKIQAQDISTQSRT